MVIHDFSIDVALAKSHQIRIQKVDQRLSDFGPDILLGGKTRKVLGQLDYQVVLLARPRIFHRLLFSYRGWK